MSRIRLAFTGLIIFSTVIAVGDIQAVEYPYLAKPVSGNVNIRSGAGIAYYSCGKLDSEETVTVVDEVFGWAKIVPPKGSFSWIAEKYVDIDPANSKVGIVNADDVRVWVGSPDYDALTSSTTQIKLSKGGFDVVELLGEEDHDYLKIAPPSGAYLYVFAKELKYVGPVGSGKEEKKPEPKKVETIKVDETKKVEEKKTVEEQPVKTVDPIETPDERKKKEFKKAISKSPEVKKLIDLCSEINEKAQAEIEKPFAEQDYTELKKAVEKIASDPNAGQALKYAEYLKNLIHRYEFAASIDNILKNQSKQRQEKLTEIFQEKNSIIEEIKAKDTGKYVVMGTIQPSYVFSAGRKRYRILKDDKFICYAEPVTDIPESTIQKYYGKKVALKGKVANKTIGSVALVNFTTIVPEESMKK